MNTGKHTVTALIRPDSKGTLPEGIKTAQYSYDDDAKSLVEALQGQQFLIITLPVRATAETHSTIVKAAIKAGVSYIMPNVYGFDVFNESIRADLTSGARGYGYCSEIQELGGTYIAMICGFWYEWSLALGEQWFGFDIKNRAVTFFDDGKTLMNISTWEQCGRALAALLSLPESGTSPALSDWKNKPFYFDSFRISQRDMLDSLNRVLGTADKDWALKYEPTAKRYKDGLDEMQKGMITGFAKSMYSRVFFPNGGGDFESHTPLSNDVLGLPKESLDEATKRAIDMVESGWNPFA